MTLLKAKLDSHKRVLFCALACACLLASCRDDRVVVTDVYYIQNEMDKPVTLDFSNLLFWDTCTASLSDKHTQVYFESDDIEIPAHGTIRLHPISRDYVNPSAHEVNLVHAIGARTTLVSDSDTVSWIAYKTKINTYRMFTSDSIWSIYNTNNWQTISDENVPYTYYNIFSITQKDIERSKP